MMPKKEFDLNFGIEMRTNFDKEDIKKGIFG